MFMYRQNFYLRKNHKINIQMGLKIIKITFYSRLKTKPLHWRTFVTQPTLRRIYIVPIFFCFPLMYLLAQRQYAGLWYPSSLVQTRPKPSDFSGRKNPQHAFLRRGSKGRRFTACKRSLNVTWKSGVFRQNSSSTSRPSNSSFHYQGLWWSHLAVQVGTTKDQGLYNKPSAAVHPGALALLAFLVTEHLLNIVRWHFYISISSSLLHFIYNSARKYNIYRICKHGELNVKWPRRAQGIHIRWQSVSVNQQYVMFPFVSAPMNPSNSQPQLQFTAHNTV